VFDIGTGELLALAVLALLILGPEKLPHYAAEAARFIRQVRSLANDARSEVQRELGPEIDGLGLRELNPRALVRKHVLDGLDLDDDSTTARAPQEAPRTETQQPSASPPYDPDTT
jgi:sec-independent protein translocase protein TatB